MSLTLHSLGSIRTTATAIAAAAAAALACGQPSVSPPEDAAIAARAASLQGIEAALYDAARREGALVLWGPASDTVMKYFPQEFEKAYPGIAVTGIGDNQAPTKLVMEMRAGRHTADALWWPYTGAFALHERDLLAPFTAEELAAFGLTSDDVALDNRALKVANFVYGLVYDTRRFAPADLPESWDEVAVPTWRGRLVGTTLTAPFLVAGMGLVKGEAWALDYARSLRALQAAMVPEPMLALEMILRGERDLMINTPSFALQRHHWQGTPVAWHPLSPTIATQHVGVVIARGPNPNAARLWALWTAGAEGQRAMDAASFEASARPGAPTTQARMLEAAGTEVIFDTPEMVRPRLALHDKVRPILFGETQ